ncbi:MAG: RNA polymerase sigma factor, partial [Candidatus Acidiferrum sp.]
TEAAVSISIPIDKIGAEAAVSDEVLLTHVAGGDQQALGCLFERYGRLLRCIAARILGDCSEAEDLVQDLFLFIHRKSAIFDCSKSSARSWIVQMAYHRAISRRRYLVTRQFYTHKQIEGVSEQVVATATTENDYSAEAVLGRNGLEKVMEALTDDQRETLNLHFFEGYTLAEISEKLGQPHGNVRNHYYRGLAQLRKQMSGSNVRIVDRHGK